MDTKFGRKNPDQNVYNTLPGLEVTQGSVGAARGQFDLKYSMVISYQSWSEEPLSRARSNALLELKVMQQLTRGQFP